MAPLSPSVWGPSAIRTQSSPERNTRAGPFGEKRSYGLPPGRWWNSRGSRQRRVPSAGWTRPSWLRWGPQDIISGCETRGHQRSCLAFSSKILQPPTPLSAHTCGLGTSTGDSGRWFCSSPCPHLPPTVCGFGPLQGAPRVRGQDSGLLSQLPLAVVFPGAAGSSSVSSTWKPARGHGRGFQHGSFQLLRLVPGSEQCPHH